jgi:hypothetical protein
MLAAKSTELKEARDWRRPFLVFSNLSASLLVIFLLESKANGYDTGNAGTGKRAAEGRAAASARSGEDGGVRGDENGSGGDGNGARALVQAAG